VVQSVRPERATLYTTAQSMNKLFLSIATSAICFTGMAPQAQAAPAWANEIASHGCRFLSQGYSPSKAGEKAGLAVLKGSNSGAFVDAYQSGNWEDSMLKALIKACPETLLEASRRTSI